MTADFFFFFRLSCWQFISLPIGKIWRYGCLYQLVRHHQWDVSNYHETFLYGYLFHLWKTRVHDSAANTSSGKNFSLIIIIGTLFLNCNRYQAGICPFSGSSLDAFAAGQLCRYVDHSGLLDTALPGDLEYRTSRYYRRGGEYLQTS